MLSCCLNILELRIGHLTWIPHIPCLTLFLFYFQCLIRRDRITASGGEVSQLNAGGGVEVFFFHICSFGYLFLQNFISLKFCIAVIEVLN